MDVEHESLFVRTQFGNNIKRFELLPPHCTFFDLMKTVENLYKDNQITVIKYKDEEEELITMNSEEEFNEALKTASKTGETLKVYLNDTENNEKNRKISKETLNRQDSKVKLRQTKNEADDIQRKNSIPLKIESASQLSKDIELVSSEVMGRIPVTSPALKCGLDTHFISQKPGYRKIRQLSSSSALGDKRNEQRRKRMKHRSGSFCSSETSESSNSSSTSSSSSSSSSDSCSEDEEAIPKRQNVHAASLNKLLSKFEKRFQLKMTEDIQTCVSEIKKEITSSVTQAVLQQLDGAVIESIKTNSSHTANDLSDLLVSSMPKNDTSKRIRYHHKNVICDNCEKEIFGPRYKCGNCSDYDLCETCEDIEGIHTPNHVFLKLHYPSVHAGRKNLGGKASPLLNLNIYEERETEREREELLQRKFDSGSELNSKTLEKIEKQRMKMRDAKRKKEAHELRKDEWKKVRKELRRNKRDISRKLKIAKMQQQQKNCMELRGVQELTLSPAGCQFCYVNPTADSTSLQDQNVMTALSGLQIVQASQENIDPELNLSTNDKPNDCLVRSISGQNYIHDDNNPGMIQTAIGIFEDIQQQSDEKEHDTIDLSQEEGSSVTSEDFIVVSKVFDLDTPLDRDEIRKRLKCETGDAEEENEDEKDNEEEEVYSDDENEGSESEEYYDSSTSKVTDQNDVPSLPTNDLSRNAFDEKLIKQTANVTDDDVQDSACLTPTPTNKIQEPIYTVIETQPSPCSLKESISSIVDKQPESRNVIQVISSQPTLHDEIMSLKETVDNTIEMPINQENQPKTLLEQAKAVQERVDQTKEAGELVVEMQEKRQKFWLEQYGKQECSVDLLKSVAEAAGSNESPAIGPSKNDKNTSFGDAITDAMASVVDAAANVAASLMQPSLPPPKAAYSKQEEDVDVITTERQNQSAFESHMGQLFDMGFFDRDLNAKLLKKHNNDIAQCVNELVLFVDNRWHQGRH